MAISEQRLFTGIAALGWLLPAGLGIASGDLLIFMILVWVAFPLTTVLFVLTIAACYGFSRWMWLPIALFTFNLMIISNMLGKFLFLF